MIVRGRVPFLWGSGDILSMCALQYHDYTLLGFRYSLDLSTLLIMIEECDKRTSCTLFWSVEGEILTLFGCRLKSHWGAQARVATHKILAVLVSMQMQIASNLADTDTPTKIPTSRGPGSPLSGLGSHRRPGLAEYCSVMPWSAMPCFSRISAKVCVCEDMAGKQNKKWGIYDTIYVHEY